MVANTYSLVTKLMNSETHSCTVSFASLAIFALVGNAFFMILLIFAIGRNRSCSLAIVYKRESPTKLMSHGPVTATAAVPFVHRFRS